MYRLYDQLIFSFNINKINYQQNLITETYYPGRASSVFNIKIAVGKSLINIAKIHSLTNIAYKIYIYSIGIFE